jgi:hypothetical protein
VDDLPIRAPKLLSEPLYLHLCMEIHSVLSKNLLMQLNETAKLNDSTPSFASFCPYRISSRTCTLYPASWRLCLTVATFL